MASFSVLPVSGLPMILLKNTAAKCVMVDAAHETTLLIHYQTPGTLHYVREHALHSSFFTALGWIEFDAVTCLIRTVYVSSHKLYYLF
jgi:hypothetical protein